MAFTYGFYNSREHDRIYSAEDFSSMFDGIIADGIFHVIPIGGDLASNDQMRVVPNGEMTVSVGRGKAWFNHTWSTNDTPYALQLEASHGIYDRYDAIVLEVRSNVEYRQNSLKVLTGTASASPTKPVLSNIKGFYQHALAYVLVHAGATQIEPEDIEDMVGTLETPFARAISDDVDLRIANSLTIPPEMEGFVLDARQGKVLDDKKVNKSDVANNLTTTASGKVLDARQGKVLQTSVSTINNQLSAPSNRNVKFQFGLTSDGQYGYVGGAGTVVPFRGKLKKIRIGAVTVDDGTSINVKDFISSHGIAGVDYKKLTNDNFLYDIITIKSKVKFTGDSQTDISRFTDNAVYIFSDIIGLHDKIGNIYPTYSYSPSSGIITFYGMWSEQVDNKFARASYSKTDYYNPGGSTTWERHTSSDYYTCTIRMEASLDVYLVY